MFLLWTRCGHRTVLPLGPYLTHARRARASGLFVILCLMHLRVYKKNIKCQQS